MGQNPSPQAARRTWLKPPHRLAQLRRSIPTRRSFFARAIALSAPAFLDRSQDARQERSLRSQAHLSRSIVQAGARDHSTLANHSFSLARSRFQPLPSSIARKMRAKNARCARRRIFLAQSSRQGRAITRRSRTIVFRSRDRAFSPCLPRSLARCAPRTLAALAGASFSLNRPGRGARSLDAREP